jgi:hypothetical protein
MWDAACKARRDRVRRLERDRCQWRIREGVGRDEMCSPARRSPARASGGDVPRRGTRWGLMQRDARQTCGRGKIRLAPWARAARPAARRCCANGSSASTTSSEPACGGHERGLSEGRAPMPKSALRTGRRATSVSSRRTRRKFAPRTCETWSFEFHFRITDECDGINALNTVTSTHTRRTNRVACRQEDKPTTPKDAASL